MKTLTANVAEKSLLQGNSPRFFVRIPDADLFLATKTQVDSSSAESFTDTIEQLGTITESIDWLGGMGAVSGLDMRNLVLGQHLTLCTEAEKTPKFTQQGANIVLGAGRVESNNFNYDLCRNAILGNAGTPAIVAGRKYELSSGIYYDFRGYLYFDDPDGIITCEEGVIELIGAGKSTTSDFELYLVQGNFTSINGAMFNDFVGWGITGAYDAIPLNETWNSAEHSAAGINRIRLNAAGRAYIEAQTGSTVKFMLLSKNDHDDASAPTGNEWVQFMASTATLKLRYNSKKLDNKTASIYLDYEPVATFYTGMQLLRSFIIDDYSITDSSLDLRLKDNNFKHAPDIPRRLINTDDWENCPDENIGKPYPVIYGTFSASGEHRNGVGNFYGEGPLATTINYSYPIDCFRVLVVKEIENSSARSVLFSELKIKSGSLPLFIWNSSQCQFEIYPVKGGTLFYDATVGSWRNHTPTEKNTVFPEALCEQVYKSLVTVLPHSTEDTTGVTDPENVYDSDSDTYAVLNNSSSILYLYFKNPSGTVDAAAFVIYAEFLGGATATELHLSLERDNRTHIEDLHDWQNVTDEQLWSADSQEEYAFFNLDASNIRSGTNLEQYRYKLYRTTSIGTIRLYDACIVCATANEAPKELYSYGTGQYDDSSGTITGSADALLENPSHIIESVARDEMSLAAADINTDSFDDAATELDGWKFAFEILDSRKANQHLDTLSAQCRSRIFWDYLDRLKLVTFDADAPFSISGTDIPSGLDIFDSTGSPSGGSFTTNPILPNSLTIRRINIDRVYNDFKLRYRKNYASGEYSGLLYMDNGSGVAASVATNIDEANLENGQTLDALKELAAASYTAYGATRSITFDADCIRDEATATMLLQYLIERTTMRRYEVSVKTLFTAVGHELGDIINIRDSRLNDLFGEARILVKKWEITDIETVMDTCEIDITAVEV